MSDGNRSGRKKKLPSAKPRLRRIPHILLLIDTSGSHGRCIVEGIGRYALEHGPWSIQFEYRALDSLPTPWLKEWQGDGIISRTVSAKQARLLRATRLPVVELHGSPKTNMFLVKTDFAKEGRMVLEHFLGRGLRQFAFFTLGEAWWTKMVREGFFQVVREQGYECLNFPLPPSNRSMPIWHEHQRPELIKWIRKLPRPIGIMTPGDLHAARLLDLCRELRIAVPGEIAIMGRGNDPVICETVRPTLSSLDLDGRRWGYEAARCLDHMMTGEKTDDFIRIPTSRVVIRQSTDLMVIDDLDVVQALHFIRDFACSSIDVDQVAEEIGVSRRSLERRFRRHLGHSPKEEIIRIRIERAKTLLAQTDNTGESIARKSGFASLIYFTKAFRREVGMTPNAYRKMQRISRDPSGTDEQ